MDRETLTAGFPSGCVVSKYKYYYIGSRKLNCAVALDHHRVASGKAAERPGNRAGEPVSARPEPEDLAGSGGKKPRGVLALFAEYPAVARDGWDRFCSCVFNRAPAEWGGWAAPLPGEVGDHETGERGLARAAVGSADSDKERSSHRPRANARAQPPAAGDVVSETGSA